MALAEQHCHAGLSEDSLARLVSGVAHDLTNALGAIANLAVLLDRRVEDAAVRHDVEAIHAAARQATDLVRRLVRVAGNGVAQPAMIDLDEVVRTALDGVGRSAGVVVRIAPGAGPVRAWFDHQHLVEILAEVALNAVEAMPAGGVIDVAIEPAPSPDAHATVRITDHGVGMPESIRDRATEPFATTKPAAPGRGLGLTVVACLLERNDGRLDIDSAPGVGTTVRLSVPSVEFEKRAVDG
ncbi:MAG TPA: ATP-binding protein [Mycobacteriales bacterium]|nr:ATP-binding protein [Mycobacteriales bacterium]